MKNTKKAILVILDGWGKGQNPAVDAIAQANTPYVDSLYQKYPNADLVTFGEEVGLPEGQMGNSEVGHLNIGAGRVVYQDFTRINIAIRENTLKDNEVLVQAIELAKKEGKKVHLMGLLSDGGVHSHINHVKALTDILTDAGVKETYIHAFMDGRDTSPTGGYNYLKDLLEHIDNQPVELASVIGRYYAMDRDKRWERVQLAYDLMVNGVGEASSDVLATIKERYAEKQSDEFIMPIVCADAQGQPKSKIADGDIVLCFNFRTDRPREITEVLTQKDFEEFGMKKLDVHYLCMTRYDATFKNVEVMFTKDDIQNTIGEVVANAGMTQVRIAETEKYPHVTFFFSGGREATFEGEKRIVIPSPKVATYDLQPEMSANEVTTAIIESIETEQPNFIALNYANTDMVGHTGDIEAAKQSAVAVDTCLKQLMEVCLKHDYQAIVIADHGNSDIMMNEDGTPHTAHTTNMVPIFYVGNNTQGATLNNGKLADVATTLLHLLDVEAPEDMTGEVLIERK